MCSAVCRAFATTHGRGRRGMSGKTNSTRECGREAERGTRSVCATSSWCAGYESSLINRGDGGGPPSRRARRCVPALRRAASWCLLGVAFREVVSLGWPCAGLAVPAFGFLGRPHALAADGAVSPPPGTEGLRASSSRFICSTASATPGLGFAASRPISQHASPQPTAARGDLPFASAPG